jgi:hypothetical protein
MKTKVIIFAGLTIVTVLLLKYLAGCVNPDEKCAENNVFGYQVWAGDTYYGDKSDAQNYYYNIDKHGYVLIGSGNTTQTFNTGTHQYFVLVGADYACIDAIKYKNGTYLGDGNVSVIDGNTDYLDIVGAPDGNSGRLGHKSQCKKDFSFLGFITESGKISDRGGELTVIVSTSDCQTK